MGAGGLIFGGIEAGGFAAVDRLRLLDGLAEDGADGISAACICVLIDGGFARDGFLEAGLGFEEEG